MKIMQTVEILKLINKISLALIKKEVTVSGTPTTADGTTITITIGNANNATITFSEGDDEL